jgi:hypothetical protein
VKADLTVHDDIILRGSQQLVVPLSMRKKIISELHKGHLGISKCIERAKNSVYWPGYLSQIKDLVEACATCQENARANAKTVLEPYDIPDYPMQTVSMDIFYLQGTEYLVTVDRYSKWPTCTELKNSTSKEIIEILKRQFLDFGRPETLISDNASYFVSNEFQWFMEEFDIKHITASQYYSQSNGLAERMNQTIKSSLHKAKQTNQTLYDVLTTLRSTPLGEGLPPPSVLLQGRNLRTSLNCMPKQLEAQQIDTKKVMEAFQARQAKLQMYRSSENRAKEFIEGMNVWVRVGHRKWVEGKVLGHAETPHSFHIKLETGLVTRRNQSHLRVRKTAAISSDLRGSEVVISGESQNTQRENNQHAPLAATDLTVPTAPSSIPVGQGSGSQAATRSYSAVTRGGRVSKPPIRFGQNIYS